MASESVPDIRMNQPPTSRLRLTSNNGGWHLDAPELNGVPIMCVTDLELKCSPMGIPQLRLTVDVDALDVDLPVETTVVAKRRPLVGWPLLNFTRTFPKSGLWHPRWKWVEKLVGYSYYVRHEPMDEEWNSVLRTADRAVNPETTEG